MRKDFISIPVIHMIKVIKDIVELCNWGYSLVWGRSIREKSTRVVAFKVKIKR